MPRPTDPTRVSLTTVDGVVLAASWRPLAERPQAPGLLLVHNFSRDRREWEGLAPLFAARGFATLAIDLRGHGESTTRSGSGDAVRLSPRLLTDPNGFPRDVEAACAWLRQRSGRVGAVGLSTGGLLAVVASASLWVEAAVSISANADALARLAGPRPTAAVGLLALASESDPGRAASARALVASATEPKRFLVLPGAAHNLALLSEKPEARDAVLDWLAARLGATPLPAPSPAVSPTPAPTPPPLPRAPAPATPETVR